MSYTPIHRSYLFSVPFAATAPQGTTVPFRDQARIRQVITYGIEAYYKTTLVADLEGRATITIADAAKVLCNFQVGSDKVIENIPLYALLTDLNSGRIKQFQGQVFNFDKSTVQATAAFVAANISSVTFNVFYRELTDAQPDWFFKLNPQFRRGPGGIAIPNKSR